MARGLSLESQHLKQLWLDVTAVTLRVEALLESHSEGQLNWHPRQGSWSIAECILHLIATADTYHPRLRAAVRYARDNSLLAKRPYKPGVVARRFIAAVGPDSRVRIPTFRAFQPESSEWDPTVLPRFVRQQAELISIIRDADGHELNAVKFPSPVSRWLRFSVGEGLELLVRHQERHVRQAEDRRQMPGFPVSDGGT